MTRLRIVEALRGVFGGALLPACFVALLRAAELLEVTR
jgi:hypothetical protein